MSAQDNSGPAFPHPDYLAAGWAGMTLRDYFAAKAMQATIIGLTPTGALEEAEAAEVVAKSAYFMADAMLKARQS